LILFLIEIQGTSFMKRGWIRVYPWHTIKED